MPKEALLYKKAENNRTDCLLCSHYCKIQEGKYGICGVRQNIKGTLYTHAYGEVIAMHVDPIEKKPFFHFLPGTEAFSIAAVGCNFRCGFCQNWQISQKKEADRLGVKAEQISPEEIVRQALRYKCRSISYTYTEPTIFFEYTFDTSKIAKENGLYNNYVTNGYMTREMLDMYSPYLDSANIDLKFFNDESYRKICGGKLGPVLESIRYMHKLGIWIEMTTLVVPGQNDSHEELKGIAEFIAGVGKEIPWHISRFHPDYNMTDLPATPLDKLREAHELGREAGLRYVYIGNVMEEEVTYCYKCGEDLIGRSGFSITRNRLDDSKCPKCGAVIDGRF